MEYVAVIQVKGPWTGCCTVAIFLTRLDELWVHMGGLAAASARHCSFADAAFDLSRTQTSMVCLVPLELNGNVLQSWWDHERAVALLAVPLMRLGDLWIFVGGLASASTRPC